jgi:hypothetical protein
MARAALRLLQHGLHSQWHNSGGHFIGLMAHHGHNTARLERQACTHNILDQRASASAMKHFRKRRFEPRALARRQNHNYKVGNRHISIVSGSDRFDNQVEAGGMRIEYLIPGTQEGRTQSSV